MTEPKNQKKIVYKITTINKWSLKLKWSLGDIVHIAFNLNKN